MIDARSTGRKEFSGPIEIELSAAATSGAGALALLARGLDISSCGVGVLADLPLVKGMVLRLSCPVEGCDIRLSLFAEVAWAAPACGLFRAGLRFLY